jgi:integrase
MTDALPLRIFLASPGDIADEREVVRLCVDEHRERGKDQSSVAYEVVGWERVRGTARRPQEAINELISESHFLIVLFKGSWGSEPGSPWGYSSGTEEELFTGLLAREPVHVVSQRLGHANPIITLTVYAHVMPGNQREAANTFARLVREARA